MKLLKHIANLGYGSRRDVQWMFREGRITDTDGEVLYADDPLDHDNVRIDGRVPATLITLDGVAGPEYWIVHNNFKAITTYNISRLYATAVYQLAQAIAGREVDGA